MEHLNNEIDTIKEQLSEPDKTLVSNDELIKSSKYPFNKYANIFSVLLTKGNLSYDILSIFMLILAYHFIKS